MNPIIKFFHELMNPHCPHCQELKDIEFEVNRESIRCRSCESLERQLAVANEQNIKLTEKIVNPNPQPVIAIQEQAPKVLHRGQVPFSVIRRTLESESRAAAEAAKHAAKPDSIAEDRIETTSELEDAVLNASVERQAEVGTRQS